MKPIKLIYPFKDKMVKESQTTRKNLNKYGNNKQQSSDDSVWLIFFGVILVASTALESWKKLTPYWSTHRLFVVLGAVGILLGVTYLLWLVFTFKVNYRVQNANVATFEKYFKRKDPVESKEIRLKKAKIAYQFHNWLTDRESGAKQFARRWTANGSEYWDCVVKDNYKKIKKVWLSPVKNVTFHNGDEKLRVVIHDGGNANVIESFSTSFASIAKKYAQLLVHSGMKSGEYEFTQAIRNNAKAKRNDPTVDLVLEFEKTKSSQDNIERIVKNPKKSSLKSKRADEAEKLPWENEKADDIED